MLSNLKSSLISLGALIFLIMGAGCQNWLKNQSCSISLWEILDYYNFKLPEQKRALELVLQNAGAIKSTETLNEIFPKRDNSSLLFKDILHFVSITQKHFTIRTGAQERWEIQPPQWTKENKKEILDALIKLDLTKEITPTLHHTDVICVLGSTLPSMNTRLSYMAKLFHAGILKAKHLVLLAGERKAKIGVDESQKQLLKIAKKHHIGKLHHLTETHLIQEAYQNSTVFNQLPMTVINTPARDLPRPTTETTVHELCQWLRMHPTMQKITFISSQPNVKYQEAIIKEVFKREKLQATIDVIGPSVDINKIEIQALVGALGSQIWAKTPDVIAKTKIKTRDEEVIKAFKELYLKQPLIYKNVEALFTPNM